MDEQYTKRLVFDIEPRELVRLLRGHRKAKAGPFSWKVRHEGREVGLFLVVEKSDKDGFEGMVSTILYRMPGSGFLAKEGEPVATLHGMRVREGETLVLIKCPEPKATGWIFTNFVLGMEELQKEVTRSATGEEPEPTIRREPPPARPRQTPVSPEHSQKVKDEAQKPEVSTQVAKDEEQQPAALAQQAKGEPSSPGEPTPAAKIEPKQGDAGTPTEAMLWLQIPDVGWDRIAVRLVHQGYSSAEIARKIEKGIVPKTVENRLSALRAQYGPEIVPYRKRPARNRNKLG